MADRKIVERNFERMTGYKKGHMMPNILDESMGRGTWQGYSCVVANFYFHPDTGEMVYFDNCQRVHPIIQKLFSEGALIIAVETAGEGRYRIVESNLGENIKRNARENLEASIKEFNNRVWFKLEALAEEK